MPLISGPARARISGEGGRRVPWIALVFVSIVAQLAWMDATVGTYDEGLVLVGADRVLRGEMPYRDFWTLYGPGSYYLLAELFRVFGEFALVERGLDVAAKTAIATLVVALVLQFGRRTRRLGGRRALARPASLSPQLLGTSVPSHGCVARHCLVLSPRLDRCAAHAGILGGRRPRVHDLLSSRPGRLHPPGRRGVHDLARMGRIDRSAPPSRARARSAGLPSGTPSPSVRWWPTSPSTYRPPSCIRDLVDAPFSVYPRVRALPFPSIVDALSSAVRSRSPTKLGPLVVYLPLVVMAGAIATELLARGSPRVTGTSDAGAEDVRVTQPPVRTAGPARRPVFPQGSGEGLAFANGCFARSSQSPSWARSSRGHATRRGACSWRAPRALPAWPAREADHHGDGTIGWWHGDGGIVVGSMDESCHGAL